MTRPKLDTDEIVTVFRNGEVTLRSNRRTDGFTTSEKEIGYHHVEPGDLAIHKMDGGFGAIGISDSEGKVSPVVNLYQSAYCDLRYVKYFLLATASSGYIKSLQKGIRERSVEFDHARFSNFYIPFPTREEQERIANYLDAETAQIDELVAELDSYIRLSELRKNKIIRRTLNTAESTTKPIFTIASINSGDVIPGEDIQDSGPYPVFGGNGLRGYTDKNNQTADRVLIGRQGALCGNVHLAKGPLFASEHALVVSPIDDADINLNWLALTLSALELGHLSQASAQPGISASEVLRQRIPDVSLERQDEIAEQTTTEISKISAMAAACQELRELLVKRRQVLITDVVTGKVEV